MTDKADTQRLLGKLVAGQEAQGRQMDRIERVLCGQAKAHNLTRDWVIEQRTAINVLRWIAMFCVGSLGVLGLDWWHR